MKTDDGHKGAATTIVRWSARVSGLVTAGFFLFMFIGESLESHPASGPAAPLTLAAWVGLALMGVYVVAMLLALKWERAGALLGAVALGIFFILLFLGLFPGNVEGGLSRKGIFNPFLLAFWLPITLYWLCWQLQGRTQPQA